MIMSTKYEEALKAIAAAPAGTTLFLDTDEMTVSEFVSFYCEEIGTKTGDEITDYALVEKLNDLFGEAIIKVRVSKEVEFIVVDCLMGDYRHRTYSATSWKGIRAQLDYDKKVLHTFFTDAAFKEITEAQKASR